MKKNVSLDNQSIGFQRLLDSDETGPKEEINWGDLATTASSCYVQQ